jgi:ABC-type proline/glycine betaine transport system permease subunit
MKRGHAIPILATFAMLLSLMGCGVAVVRTSIRLPLLARTFSPLRSIQDQLGTMRMVHLPA